MLSNDVTEAPCRAMLLTPKARLIAPLAVVRRADDDFLLLTEPGLGETVGATLLRARFAAKVEIEPEEHTSVVVFGEDGGIPNEELGEPGSELLDADVAPTLSADEVERVRIESATPAWGKELDDTILPAEAGLDETHVSFSKGCYPGQEPIARLRHRWKVNRTLRALEVDGADRATRSARATRSSVESRAVGPGARLCPCRGSGRRRARGRGKRENRSHASRVGTTR
jgi:folate-binding protein YgfZ